MPNLAITAAGGAASFDSGDITLNTSTYTKVGSVSIVNYNGRLILQITVGGGHALTSLKITRAAIPGGHDAGNQVDLAVDTDLNTATDEIPNVIPVSAYTAASGTEIQIVLNCNGAAEFGVWAKSAAGTARLRGYIPQGD